MKYLSSVSDLIENPLPVSGKDVIVDLSHSLCRGFDIISSDPHCVHLGVKDCKCKSCGAFVGYFGDEKVSNDYFRHLLMIVNALESAENVFIISKRLFPEGYKLPFMPTSKASSSGFNFHRNYTLYDKVVSDPRSDANVTSFHVSHFTNKSSHLWKPRVLLSKKLNLFDFITGEAIFINPNPKWPHPSSSEVTLYSSNPAKDILKTKSLFS